MCVCVNEILTAKDKDQWRLLQTLTDVRVPQMTAMSWPMSDPVSHEGLYFMEIAPFAEMVKNQACTHTHTYKQKI